MKSHPCPDLVNLVHQNKAFSPQGFLERLFTIWFDGFVYNQIWEDPRVDIAGLKLDGRSRIITIASGGCNILNYLTVRPEAVMAVDLNPCHLALTRLKLAAVRHLPSHEDLFQFFGCADEAVNVHNYYRYLRPQLDEATRTFWDGGTWLAVKMHGPRINYFQRNLYHHGSMGLFIRFLHTLARLKKIDPKRFLEARTIADRARLFEEICAPVFDSRLVQGLAKLPFLLHGLGVPPAQFARLKAESGGDLLADYKGRIRRLFCDFPIQDNYFAWQALACGYDRNQRRAVPDYLKKQNYALLRTNLHRVQTHLHSLTSFLKTQPARSLNRFVFLDAQDWMNPQQINELWREVGRVGQPGSRILFRTGAAESVVESALEQGLRERFVYEQELSQELFRADRSAIYGGVHVYEMKN